MKALGISFFAILTAVCLASLLGCPPQPLELTSLEPSLALYRVPGDVEVVAAFNQTVDASSINDSTFYVTLGEASDAPHVPGTLSVNLKRVTFSPATPFSFGVRYDVWITGDVLSNGGSAFNGVFPDVKYGNTEVDAPDNVFVVNKPNDLDDSEAGSGYDLLGYNPLYPRTYDPTIPEQCPGISATEAWKFTTGRPDVLVAVIDNGLEDYASPDFQRTLFLNRGELPLPRNDLGQSVCDVGACDDPFDWNLDGRFNVFDYADAGYAIGPSGTLIPVADENGNSRVDVDDLLLAFADDADGYLSDPDAPDDVNGIVDDISGYDFYRKVPLALGMADFPEGTHGHGRSEEIAAEADNGSGTPGVCPDCTVLAIRVTYALIEEGELVAKAIRYALDLQADVIVAALGALNGTREEEKAVEAAHAAGVPIITGPGDESSFHHSYPSVLNHIITVKANTSNFLESYCTGYGGQIHAAAVGQCGSTASGRSAGAAGLVVSRARELGYCATSDPSDPNCTLPDLSANEVKQILSLTAEKPKKESACMGVITSAPCKLDTWDMHQGYGRLNLFRAMIRLEQDPLPPAVEILSPAWFTYFDLPSTPSLHLEGTVSARVSLDSVECAFAPGIEPDEVDFSVFPCDLDEYGTLSGDLSLDTVASSLGGVSGPPEGPEARTFTVRVRGTASGSLGEDRRVFAVHTDPDLVAGFPLSLADLDEDDVEEITPDARNAPSIEASPALADLDQDGTDEIVIVTSNSFLHALTYDNVLQRIEELPGYPIPIRRLPVQNDGISAAPAVGDVDLDGNPDIVVATLGGYVFAFRGIDGQPLTLPDGCVGQADIPSNGTAEEYGAGNTFFSSPVLTDLNGDDYPDVVLGCGDQKVYAFSGLSIASGSPSRLDGWPVTVEDPGSCSTLANSVLGTVAAVDITDDMVPEILAGTSESCDTPDEAAGRLYAIHPEGDLHVGGPYVSGFPVGIEPNELGVEIPLPPLTTGIAGAPVAARFGSDVVIGTGTFFGPVTLVHVNVATGQVTTDRLPSGLNFGAGGTGAFGTDAMGDLVYAVATATLGPSPGHGPVALTHRTLLWDLQQTSAFVIHPNDDFMLLGNPVFADVSGDGIPELVTGSGGHLVHAYTDPETEADGWPKFSYGWHMASPAMGDLDGDGLLELVAPVREGRIFAWHTDAPLCGNHPWPTYHHDNLRTGNLDEIIEDPRCPSYSVP